MLFHKDKQEAAVEFISISESYERYNNNNVFWLLTLINEQNISGNPRTHRGQNGQRVMPLDYHHYREYGEVQFPGFGSPYSTENCANFPVKCLKCVNDKIIIHFFLPPKYHHSLLMLFQSWNKILLHMTLLTSFYNYKPVCLKGICGAKMTY